MEEKRIDPLQIIGMILIFGIFTWMMYNQSAEELAQADTKAAQESVQRPETETPAVSPIPEASEVIDLSDEAIVETMVLRNNVLELGVSTKGGILEQVLLQDMVNYQDEALYLINKENNALNIAFTTSTGQLLQTKFLVFTPTLSKVPNGQELRLRAPLNTEGFIELIYTLPNEGYRFGFEVIAEGISSYLDTSIPAAFSWQMDGFRHAKSAQYENRYTQLAYRHQTDKYSTLSASGEDDETEQDVAWVSYRQHFFSSILIPETPFKEAALASTSSTDEEVEASLYLKSFATETNLPYNRNGFAASFDWYMGPTDYEILRKYDENLFESISFGWGLIGWINKSVFFIPYLAS